ncbi:hypothetical protein QR685DRAFT_534770 [Neurospora intermedia]|uniref:Uncharacterized protein n=1 Tax=Neurospora intermedia TaxID=5142 RepID=A0ABR3D2I2_NEUIN
MITTYPRPRPWYGITLLYLVHMPVSFVAFSLHSAALVPVVSSSVFGSSSVESSFRWALGQFGNWTYSTDSVDNGEVKFYCSGLTSVSGSGVPPCECLHPSLELRLGWCTVFSILGF